MYDHVSYYLDTLKTCDWRVRARAAREFSSYQKDSRARSGLVELLYDNSVEVRRVAADALSRVAMYPEVWPTLILARADSDPIVRDLISKALQPPLQAPAPHLIGLVSRLVERGRLFRIQH